MEVNRIAKVFVPFLFSNEFRSTNIEKCYFLDGKWYNLLKMYLIYYRIKQSFNRSPRIHRRWSRFTDNTTEQPFVFVTSFEYSNQYRIGSNISRFEK